MGALTALFKSEPKAVPTAVPASAATVAYIDRGRVGKSNVAMYRNWAEHSEWVKAAINIRKNQVSTADWDIVPHDKDRPYGVRLARQIKNLMLEPNQTLTSFSEFIKLAIDDILVLDAGSIELVRSLRKQIVQLWNVDGGTVRVHALWDGGSPNEPRYYWYPDHQPRASWKNADFIYLMANSATNRVIGLSPLETLKMTIDSELAGADYNRRQVLNAAPDGLLDLGEGARPEDVERFKSYWAAEVAGRGALGFIGNTKGAKFIPFRGTNRDMQFLEWQQYLVRKIAAVFGLSPQDLGMGFEINRSTAETQERQTEDRGLRPLMSLVQEAITRKIVWDEHFGGPENNLAFRFSALNLKESLAKAQVNKLALAGVSWKTINEARIDDGRGPIGDLSDETNPANQLMVITPTGAVTLNEVPTARELLDMKAAPSGPPAGGQN